MAFAELESLRIHYELAGDTSLPVLVLSNSLGVNMDMWEPQISGLSSHFRLLRCDTRGQGKSSTPTGPYSVEQLGKDMVGLFDLLEIEQASFCGLSMGGAVGQWLALNAPKRLQKLVLANTAAKFGTAETWNARIALVSSQGLDPVIPGTLERWFTGAFRMAQPETTARITAILRANSVEGYIACCAAVRDTDFRAELRQIHVPTLVISGSQDPVTPPSDGQFLAQNIANAQYVELPAQHLSNLEAPSQFTTALLSFLQA